MLRWLSQLAQAQVGDAEPLDRDGSGPERRADSPSLLPPALLEQLLGTVLVNR